MALPLTLSRACLDPCHAGQAGSEIRLQKTAGWVRIPAWPFTAGALSDPQCPHLTGDHESRSHRVREKLECWVQNHAAHLGPSAPPGLPGWLTKEPLT